MTSEVVHHSASQAPSVVDTRSRGLPALSRPPGEGRTQVSSENPRSLHLGCPFSPPSATLNSESAFKTQLNSHILRKLSLTPPSILDSLILDSLILDSLLHRALWDAQLRDSTLEARGWVQVSAWH